MGIKQFSNPASGYVNKFLGQEVFDSTGKGTGFQTDVVPGGHTATGGVISDYNTPTGDIYRAHIFTATGTFDVSALSTSYAANVEYVVVAGGGGGFGGGGGAGGYRSSITGESTGGGGSLESALPITASPYTVTIGAGGAGAATGGSFAAAQAASNGGDSSLGPTIVSTGGGKANGPGGSPAPSGGSGGGNGGAANGGEGTANQGYDGGMGNSGS